jgi:hypothetical protein
MNFFLPARHFFTILFIFHCLCQTLPMRRRTAPPKRPPGPPASFKDGAAAVLKAAVKLFDRQDGQGVDNRMLAEILFHASFETLDRLPDDQKQAIARRVHAGAYGRMVGNEEGGFSAGHKGPGQGAEPSPSTLENDSAPRGFPGPGSK